MGTRLIDLDSSAGRRRRHRGMRPDGDGTQRAVAEIRSHLHRRQVAADAIRQVHPDRADPADRREGRPGKRSRPAADSVVQKPVVKTVTLENIDGLNGVSGGDVGKAEASINGSSVYTITGTAVVSDPATRARRRTCPSIEAPC